ncbi:MAG TPA: peptidoglycan-associated lipoprotein Pal [Thermoanaerobaculia bacterium]|nr:peptidoglycan-associated lipoprotein Pal [Thermoanaerobaculia bacterium]
MRKTVLAISSVVVLLVSMSCARKKPVVPPAPPPVETSAAPAPAAPPEEPAAPADPLAGDLDSVNEYVRTQGLLRDVYYAYDSAALSPEARQALAANARFLSGHPEFEVVIEGHCDERGTNEYNLALGERRASSARDYLASLGVRGDRLRTLSYGEERPACHDSDEACWSQNRRCHFLIAARRGPS